MIFQGNRVCKICGCEDEWNRLQWGVSSGIKQNNYAKYLRELPLTEENISMICNKFRLEYNISTNVVFIRTPFSRWIVYIQDDNVVRIDVPAADRHDKPVYIGTDPIKGTYKRDYEGDFLCTEEAVRAMFADQRDVSGDIEVIDEMGLDVLNQDSVINISM